MRSAGGAGDPSIPGLETLKNSVDLVEMPFKAVDIADKLITWMNSGGAGADPIAAALGRIDTALNRIEDLQLATWKTARGDNLAFLRAHSSTALKTAAAYLEAGRPRGDSVWAAKIALAERDSALAVDTFASNIDSGYWLRPQSLKAISWAGDPNEWMAWIPDRAPATVEGLVWDHRWALPAATYAIAVRMAVLKAFDSGTESDARQRCEEAKSHQAFLSDVWSRMYAGVRRSTLKPEQYPRFSQGELPAAAVDLNGGYFISARIQMGLSPSQQGLPAEVVPSGFSTDFTFDALKANAELLNNYWFGLVCQRIGLDEILVLASRMQDECAEPVTPIHDLVHEAGELIHHIDPGKLKLAAVARELHRLAGAGVRDGQAGPSRVLDIFRALSADDAESRDLSVKFVSDLAQLGNRMGRPAR
ncbi:hypothetical protein ACQP1G_20470 [Nocardia sp. CA-107356]|uniref:hypothetical protein n=1 Tax=Nocardia sp. CA-107356 TaxID=3239972 RepID=UPI003D92EBC9